MTLDELRTQMIAVTENECKTVVGGKPPPQPSPLKQDQKFRYPPGTKLRRPHTSRSRPPLKPLSATARPLMSFLDASLLARLTHDQAGEIGAVATSLYNRERGRKPPRGLAVINLPADGEPRECLCRHYEPGDRDIIVIAVLQWQQDVRAGKAQRPWEGRRR